MKGRHVTIAIAVISVLALLAQLLRSASLFSGSNLDGATADLPGVGQRRVVTTAADAAINKDKSAAQPGAAQRVAGKPDKLRVVDAILGDASRDAPRKQKDGEDNEAEEPRKGPAQVLTMMARHTEPPVKTKAPRDDTEDAQTGTLPPPPPHATPATRLPTVTNLTPTPPPPPPVKSGAVLAARSCKDKDCDDNTTSTVARWILCADLWRWEETWTATPNSGRKTQADVLFMHIPHTGASSILALLKNVGGYVFWKFPNTDKFDFQSIANRRMVGGDLPFGFDKWWGSDPVNSLIYTKRYPPFNYATVFRDPIDRVLSHYYYERSADYAKHYKLAQKLNLSQWIEETPFAQNYMTAYLSGGAPNAFYNEGEFLDAERRVPLVPRVNKLMPWDMTEWHFERAKENLIKRFMLVGLVDRPLETRVLFAHIFGWRRIMTKDLEHYHETVGRPKRHEIDPQDLERIRDLNEWDLKLFDFAEYLFEKQVEWFGGAKKLAIAVRRLPEWVLPMAQPLIGPNKR